MPHQDNPNKITEVAAANLPAAMPPTKRKFENTWEDSAPIDLYKLLQVPWGASQREIVQGYYRMALQVHPDRGGDTQKFQEVAHAYEILSGAGLRHQYNVSVLEHGQRNGLNLEAANAGTRPVAHVLADFPADMVPVLLATAPGGWQQILEGCSRAQLGKLLDCLVALPQTGKKPVRPPKTQQTGESTVAQVSDADLSGTKYLSKKGRLARAEFYIRGLNVASPYSPLIPVLAFYHSAVVEFRSKLLQSLQAEPDVSMETAMAEALKALAPTVFCCFNFRSKRMVEGKFHYTPLVDDWPMALEMHRELQKACSSQKVKVLKKKWEQMVRESKAELETRRLEKAQELRGYILCQQEACCDVTTLRLRRHSKQPAEWVKLPLAELQQLLKKPDGNMALMQLLGVRAARLELPAPLPVCGWAQIPEAGKAAVFAFTSLVDLARLAATRKASWQEVRAHLGKEVGLSPQDTGGTLPEQFLRSHLLRSRLLHRFRERCVWGWSTNRMRPHPAVG